MNLNDRSHVFVKLSDRIKNLKGTELEELFNSAYISNKWFIDENISKAFEGITHMLTIKKLNHWTKNYHLTPSEPKKIGIIMAGNIPMVGFHDLMSVLLSGHHAHVKLSSQDQPLMQWVIDQLSEISESFRSSIKVQERLTDIDAIIATGSDNSCRYFEYYFGKYPHIIRKNRTSIAVLTGDETEDELLRLGEDVYSYFGLGCRNISKLFIPPSYDFKKLLDSWQAFADVLEHYKYKNNYDYQKSILLVNGEPHLDSGFSLMRETDQLVSPLTTTYYQVYQDQNELASLLDFQSDKLQCIVSNGLEKDHVPFGQTQLPEPWDYADGVDTLYFLDNLTKYIEN